MECVFECTVLCICYVPCRVKGECVVISLDHSSCVTCPVVVHAVLPIGGVGFQSLVIHDINASEGLNMFLTRVHKNSAPWVSSPSVFNVSSILQNSTRSGKPPYLSDLIGSTTELLIF